MELKTIALFWTYLLSFGYLILIAKNFLIQNKLKKDENIPEMLKLVLNSCIQKDTEDKLYWRVVPLLSFIMFLNYII